MDNLITCNRCGSDACYVQEVNEKIKNYMCYGCGFISNTLYKKGEELFEQMSETLPELYKVLMGEEEDTGMIWVPSYVNVPDKGMVFANGTNLNQWKWAAVKSTTVKEEEKDKFKKKDGTYFENKMDMSTMKEFVERDYMDALEYIGVL